MSATRWITLTAQSCSVCGHGSSDDTPTNERYSQSPFAYCQECQRNGRAAQHHSEAIANGLDRADAAILAARFPDFYHGKFSITEQRRIRGAFFAGYCGHPHP